MRIKMVKTVKQGHADFVIGRVYDLTDDIARRLIEKGKAERMEVQSTDVDSAVIEAPETAARRRGRPRIRGVELHNEG